MGSKLEILMVLVLMAAIAFCINYLLAIEGHYLNFRLLKMMGVI